MSNYPIILGVYSLQKEVDYGTSGTAQKKENITYWYVRQINAQKFEVQPLNIHHLPSGHFSMVSKNEFLVNYVPEPNYYQNRRVQKLFDLADKVQSYGQKFNRNNLDKEDQEIIERLMIFESNIEADVDDNSKSSEVSDYEKITKVLDLLLACNDSTKFFQKQHFNNFAITLRKDGYYDKSLNYYEKTLEVNELDENLYFNMARVYFDKGLNSECVHTLKQALNINPEFEEAKKFLKYCQKKYL